MPTGKVKWFDAKKGYGFIEQDDGSSDIFCHFSSINSNGFKTLNKNDTVEYEVGDGPKGPQALNVTVTSSGGNKNNSD